MRDKPRLATWRGQSMCMYLAQVHPAEAQTGADLVVYFSLARDGRAYKNPVTSFCWFIGLELDIPYEPTVSRLPAGAAEREPDATAGLGPRPRVGVRVSPVAGRRRRRRGARHDCARPTVTPSDWCRVECCRGPDCRHGTRPLSLVWRVHDSDSTCVRCRAV